MEIKIGLWEKKSQKGNIYYNGKFKLEGKEYKISLFKNENKLNEKSPDFQLFVRDSINTQEKPKEVEIPPKNEPQEDIYADFGNKIEFTEDDFPF